MRADWATTIATRVTSVSRRWLYPPEHALPGMPGRAPLPGTVRTIPVGMRPEQCMGVIHYTGYHAPYR